jgi:hypothetical protein
LKNRFARSRRSTQFKNVYGFIYEFYILVYIQSLYLFYLLKSIWILNKIMYAPNDLFYENRIRFSEIILTYVLLLFKSLCLCTLGHACHIKYMCYLSLNLNLLTEWKVTLLKWWRCLIVLSIHVSLNCQFAKPLKQEVDMWFY